MKKPSPTSDTHDESYFASFTDMLVGIIFIFIILLMMVANNYQEATEAVIEAGEELEAARQKVLSAEYDKIREEAFKKEIAQRDQMHKKEIIERDEAYKQALAELKAQSDARLLEATRALEDLQATEAARVFQETQEAQAQQAAQNVRATEDPNAPDDALANDDPLKRQLTEKLQNIFNDSRAQVLTKIQQEMNRQGFAVAVNLNKGILLIPENLMFDTNQNSGDVNYRGRQAMHALAKLFGQYLPCISPTQGSQLYHCNSAGITPNNGLNAIFIDNYPGGKADREDKMLLSLERNISVFNELIGYEPYLDKGLKNTGGLPILDIKVNQKRRKAWNRDQSNPAFNENVVFRFIMRKPNDEDLQRLGR